MATLSITKSYDDGTLLEEADLDPFIIAPQTFVNTTKLNDDNIANSGITGSSKLKDGSITTAKIVNNGITESLIAAGAVTSAKITDANVTTAKINDLAVTTAKLNDSAVTTGKLAASAVTSAKATANFKLLPITSTTTGGSGARTVTIANTTIELNSRPLLFQIRCNLTIGFTSSGANNIKVQGTLIVKNITAGITLGSWEMTSGSADQLFSCFLEADNPNLPASGNTEISLQLVSESSADGNLITGSASSLSNYFLIQEL